MMIRHAMLSITPSFLNGDTGASLAEGGCMDATITWKRAVVTAARPQRPHPQRCLAWGWAGCGLPPVVAADERNAPQG